MESTTYLRHLLPFIALLTSLPAAFASGTAFSYQGRLNDGVAPANGSYDFLFTLYEAAAGSNQLGATLTNSGVLVRNGLFTASLDFGCVFDGNPRWLGIGVKTNGNSTFALLAPRQQLLAAPYAVYSANAATATNLYGTVSAGQLSGVLSMAQLPGGVLTNYSSGVNLRGAFSGNASGLTNFDARCLNLLGNYSNDLAVITPEAFGAVGDNVTDDSPALQAAVNAASASAAAGKTAYVALLPRLAYFINSPIVLKSNAVLVGNGKAFMGDLGGGSHFFNLRFSAAAGSCFRSSEPDLISGSRLIGLGIQGPGSNMAGTRAMDLDYHAYNPTGFYGGQSVTVSECDVWACDYGLVASGQDNLRLEGLTVYDIGSYGLWFRPGIAQAMHIFNVSAFNCHKASVFVDTGSYEFVSCDLFHDFYPGYNLVLTNCANVSFSGNMEGGSPYQIYVDASELHLKHGDYWRGTTWTTILATNNAVIDIDAEAWVGVDANNVAVVSWNSANDYITSSRTRIVSNAFFGVTYTTTQFPADLLSTYGAHPERWPGGVLQFLRGNYYVADDTYTWIGHSVTLPSLGVTSWVNWDEFGVNWNLRNRASYPKTALVVSNIQSGAVVAGSQGVFLSPNSPPPAPSVLGQSFLWNSNGTTYLLCSKPSALVWTRTNVLGGP